MLIWSDCTSSRATVHQEFSGRTLSHFHTNRERSGVVPCRLRSVPQALYYEIRRQKLHEALRKISKDIFLVASFSLNEFPVGDNNLITPTSIVLRFWDDDIPFRCR